ncbi:MAG: sigma-70 family RNA polymerase sigma factor [Chthoniobacteraceae bacterium]
MIYYRFDTQNSDESRPPAMARAPLPTGEPTDEQLMERIQQGDEDALAALHRRHEGLIRAVISRMIFDAHDVDELVQECLLEVWRHAANYEVGKGRALGWIVTLVRRRSIDRIRRKMAYGRAQERFREEVAGDCDSSYARADEEVAECDRAEAISRLLAKLPEPQQQAVHFAFYRGMTQRQIAAHTGIPLGTIKTRIELAMRKLRSSVLAFGELHEPMSVTV